MSPIVESVLVFCAIFGAAIFGMACARALPEQHISEDTRRHFTGTVSVVATLAALVLGFAISNSNTARLGTLRSLTLLSSSASRTASQLRQFGPEAADAGTVLAQYVDRTLADLFPSASVPPIVREPDVDNAETLALLDALQTKIVELHAGNDLQKFHQAQALAASNQIVAARWAIAESRNMQPPPQVINALTLWLAILFFSYGLFTPRNLTAVAAMILSGAAVSLAVMIILQGRLPFEGRFHIPADALTEAVAAVHGAGGG